MNKKISLKCFGLYAIVHTKSTVVDELSYLSIHYDIKLKNGRFCGTVPTEKKFFKNVYLYSLDNLIKKTDIKRFIITAQNRYIREILPNLENKAKEQKTEKSTTNYIVNCFLEHQQKNTSKTTYASNKCLLQDFIKSSYCTKYYKDLTLQHIEKYLNDKNNTATTYNQKLTMFKTLDTWQAAYFNNASVIGSIKYCKKTVKADAHRKAPTVKNENEFLEAIKIYTNSADYAEAKQILCFSFFCPLRIRELLNIKVKNIDFDNVCIHLEKTKTCKQGLDYPISKTLLNIFKQMIDKDNLDNESYLFSISRRYKAPYEKLFKSLKLDTYNLHGIRSVVNSYITTREAQQKLNISEADTRIYGDILLTHETKTQIQKIYNRNQNGERYQELNEIYHSFLYSVLKKEIEIFTK